MDSRPLDEIELSEAEHLREVVMDHIRRRDFEAAAAEFARLVQVDPELALARGQQLELANWLAQRGRHRLAAVAYDAFLAAYPTAAEAAQVHLFLGMILGRYLGDDAAALEHLGAAAHFLSRPDERELALQELRAVQARSGPA